MSACLLLFGLGFVFVVGAIAGLAIGMRIGREMAETRVIDYTNKSPFDSAYEVSDALFPHRVPIMIEVKGRPTAPKHEILKRHWRFN
jgi:uncharacterized protein YcfJ